MLWVDGSDPKWLEEKRRYQASRWDDASFCRYRDWGLLRYWFRGVEEYAPWVHRIFFVTWGHLPDFLNTAAPKLQIVRHEEFIPPQYLPTFNTRPIELNLHRITNLSEQFIYFNDDMLLIRSADSSDFFKNGLPCAAAPESVLYFSRANNTFSHTVGNDLGVINAHFHRREQIRKNKGKYMAACYGWRNNVRSLGVRLLFPPYFTGFNMPHGPTCNLKSTYEEVWEAEPELLDLTCREKFRSGTQVNQYVMQYWQFAKGSFVPASDKNGLYAIRPDNIDEIQAAIEQRKYQTICLQDASVDDADFRKLSRKIAESFEKILPRKSSFER